MVILQKCCCGLTLRTGSLIICYIVLVENTLSFLNVVTYSGEVSPAKSLISNRNETSGARFFNIWTSVFNIIIDCTGLYGIYKGRAPLLIPFLAYRTVTLVFMLFTLLNAKNIADALSEEIEKQVENGNEPPDLFPAVLLLIILMMALELYCVLIVYSYYQILCQSTRMIAVNVPIVSYSTQPHDQLSMYAQPPVNPYLFQAPKYPYQYENGINGVNKYAYNPNMYPNPDQLPPPYGT
ncbi:uncharacterized protein LOC135834596 [Planococcus citri]|uniref:uncharacterized protein LOC135834596 n=1 Tax=Planococcus citri TaxID=170843 RepID=UPI0031FA2012